MCAVLVSLVLACSLALLFHLLRRKAQATSHLFIFIMNVLFYTVLVGLPCSPGVSNNLMSSLVWSPLVSPSFWGSPLVDQWRLGRPRGLVKGSWKPVLSVVYAFILLFVVCGEYYCSITDYIHLSINDIHIWIHRQKCHLLHSSCLQLIASLYHVYFSFLPLPFPCLSPSPPFPSLSPSLPFLSFPLLLPSPPSPLPLPSPPLPFSSPTCNR